MAFLERVLAGCDFYRRVVKEINVCCSKKSTFAVGYCGEMQKRSVPSVHLLNISDEFESQTSQSEVIFS